MKISASTYWTLRKKCQGCYYYGACFPLNDPMRINPMNFEAIRHCPNAEVRKLIQKDAVKLQQLQTAEKTLAEENMSAALGEIRKFMEEQPRISEFYHYGPRELEEQYTSQEELDQLSQDYAEGKTKFPPENSTNWVGEIAEFYRKHVLGNQPDPSKTELIDKYYATITSMMPLELNFEASVNIEGSLLEGVLIPFPFDQKNENNWKFSDKVKPQILKLLNSGKIPLVSGHDTRDIKTHLGLISKAVFDSEGNLKISSTIEDEHVEKIVKREGSEIGLSIGCSGLAVCSVCKKPVKFGRCLDHPKATVEIIEIKKMKHASLTDSPAYAKSRITSLSD